MFKTTKGHEHEFFAKGEVLQQQLITAERAIALGPQAILIGKPLGRKVALQALALVLP
ncbi:hypothetical protein D3C77_816950 [compost metagenome]